MSNKYFLCLIAVHRALKMFRKYISLFKVSTFTCVQCTCLHTLYMPTQYTQSHYKSILGHLVCSPRSIPSPLALQLLLFHSHYDQEQHDRAVYEVPSM